LIASESKSFKNFDWKKLNDFDSDAIKKLNEMSSGEISALEDYLNAKGKSIISKAGDRAAKTEIDTSRFGYDREAAQQHVQLEKERLKTEAKTNAFSEATPYFEAAKLANVRQEAMKRYQGAEADKDLQYLELAQKQNPTELNKAINQASSKDLDHMIEFYRRQGGDEAEKYRPSENDSLLPKYKAGEQWGL